MKVGIHQFSRNKTLYFEEVYEQILSHNQIEYSKIHISQPDFWNTLQHIDYFIGRWLDTSDHYQIAHTLLPILEREYKLPCYPNYQTYWPYDDKIRQYFLLKANNFPIIESYVFWDKKDALDWLEIANLPTVFKLKGGAGSSNVILIKSKSKGKSFINKMFGAGIVSGKVPDEKNVKRTDLNLKRKIQHMGGDLLKKAVGENIDHRWMPHKNYALFQKFLPGNTFDTRVTIIGGRAICFRRFNRDDDFRASGSGKLDLKPENIDKRCIEIAQRISKHFGFQSMGYDFLYDADHNPVICEMSYTYNPKILADCPGHWDQEMNWHEGKHWPQYWHLVDFLNMPELKQPEIKIEEAPLNQKFINILKK